MACEACPCPDGCRGAPIDCEWAASGDPVKRRHVRERAAVVAAPAPLPSPDEADRIIAELERRMRERPGGGRCCG